MKPFRWYGTPDDIRLVLTLAWREIDGLRVVAGKAAPRRVLVLHDVDEAIEALSRRGTFFLCGSFATKLRGDATGFFRDLEVPCIGIQGPATSTRGKRFWHNGLPPKGALIHEGVVLPPTSLEEGTPEARTAFAQLVKSMKGVVFPIAHLWLGPFARHSVMQNRAFLEESTGEVRDSRWCAAHSRRR